MQVIDENTVVVTTSEELNKVLSEQNTYTYIYLGNDITMSSGSIINNTKEKIIIDGTYNNTKYTYTNNLSTEGEVIKVSTSNKRVILKNMNITSSHGYGVIYVPSHPNYSNVVVEYNNINFRGVELSCNYYGTTKIIDSIIEVADTNNISAQRACDSNRILIEGNTTITSTSSTNTIFFFNDVIPSLVKIIPNSRVTITTDRELMNGTNRLDLTIGHGAELLLTTGNGFAKTTTHGARNVLIEEKSTFTFIEKSHQRIPMWNIFGNLIIKEGAIVSILNTFMTTPTDNYNIYFKGANQKIIIDNPKYIKIYTKNANIWYTNNPVEYTFKISRINMWSEAKDYTSACNLEDIPPLYWYKDNYPLEIKGTFDKDTTTITSHNLTEIELTKLPEINKFTFQNKKILTIGIIKTNIQPINSNINVLSGYTIKDTNIRLEYDGKKLEVPADETGLFEFNLDDAPIDGTNYIITTCLNGVYTKKEITTPFNGELTLLEVTENIPFNTIPGEDKPLTLYKKDKTVITVVDSRAIKTNWKLYIFFVNPMIEMNGKVLVDSLFFKKFDNEIVKLSTSKKLIYESTSTSGSVEVSKVTFSTDKGLRLSPSKSLLKDEDYSTMVIWSIEE